MGAAAASAVVAGGGVQTQVGRKHSLAALASLAK